MEIDYAVYSLSDEFYEKYPNPPYKELLKKKERRYACLLIQSHYGYFICIPYRTEISHKYAYHFRKSSRSQKHRSGLDYTKIAYYKRYFVTIQQSTIPRGVWHEHANPETYKSKSLRAGSHCDGEELCR